jgi:hypothetical protein
LAEFQHEPLVQEQVFQHNSRTVSS